MALMNSFYGGRRGASFVIVKNYLDVMTMTADFAKGNDFTEVNYDEYVMINNPNKNHPDNGKIFRRGYDYNSDRTLSDVTVLCDSEGNQYAAGLTEEDYKNLNEGDHFEEGRSLQAHGAEYIGTIKGPAGKAPLLSIVPYEVAETASAKSSDFEERKVFGQYNPLKDTYQIFNPTTHEWEEKEANDSGLIPGKYGNQYNDSIQWYSTSIRNDNYGDDTQVFIGFKFPYLVTQLQTSWVEPYDANGNKYNSNTIFPISRASTDDGSHPYYNKWHLEIPKGIKGDAFSNLKVTTYHDWLASLLDSDSRIMYNSDSSVYNPEEKDTNRQILVYEAINYDNKRNGQKKYYYLGDYNQVEDVTYDDVNGKIIFSFTNQDDKEIDFKQIVKIQTGMDRWGKVEHQILDENGQPIPKKDENGNQIIEQGQPVYQTEQIEQWIPDTEEGSELGKLKILYNDDSKEIFRFPWVNGIIYNPVNSSLSYTVAGNNDNSYFIGNFVAMKSVRYLKKGQEGNNFNTDALVIEYSDTDGEGENRKQSFPIRTIKSIQITKKEDSETGKTIADLEATYYTQDGQDVQNLSENHFDFLEFFNYDSERGTFSFKRYTDDEENNVQLDYVKEIGFENGELVYKKINDNNSYKLANNIPFIKTIELDKNCNLYVQMSGNNIIVPASQEDYPGKTTNYKPDDGWYYLGNLHFSLMDDIPFTFYDWNYFKQNFLSDSDIETEYTKIRPDDLAEALTSRGVTPQNLRQGADNVIIAVGMPNQAKYFFGYSLRDIESNEEEGTTTQIGQWFYMTDLQSDHNVVIADVDTSINRGDVLLGTRTDICAITTENVSISPSLHYFQTGKPLTLKVTSVLNSNQSISVSINGTDNGSLYTYDSGIITIPNVTGDINITRITT